PGPVIVRLFVIASSLPARVIVPTTDGSNWISSPFAAAAITARRDPGAGGVGLSLMSVTTTVAACAKTAWLSNKSRPCRFSAVKNCRMQLAAFVIREETAQNICSRRQRHKGAPGNFQYPFV